MLNHIADIYIMNKLKKKSGLNFFNIYFTWYLEKYCWLQHWSMTPIILKCSIILNTSLSLDRYLAPHEILLCNYIVKLYTVCIPMF